MARHDVVIQKGHCFRKRGFTGTSGMWQGRRYTEQEFVSKVADRMASILNAAGIDTRTTLADEKVPSSLVFVALHQDGSENRAARGASIGYPPVGDGGRLGQRWKALYQLAGWPSGFRPDNYTAALQTYYGFRRSTAPARLLIEHGFATNPDDQHWMWTRWADIAEVNADAIAQHLGRSLDPTPDTDGDADMKLVQVAWFSWLNEGWRYRYLSSPTSVEAVEKGTGPAINLSSDLVKGSPAATWAHLRHEAKKAGRLAGEPADVAKAWDDFYADIT